MVLCHKVAHLFGAVACFDPKLAKYVVAISHDPAYAVGDLID
jgi:CRISPR-associated protein Csx3